ncbi:MAG: TlpA family protein disulfide reductase, partial [Lachnospiraceae bacterium]|nr:TlpA family protein disulfide reductase [Lachnospiraceae bacterium]
IEGNIVTSDIFSQSKLTMVNVWATYCNPCLSEMPGLGELAAEFDTEEFQIIGIISDVVEGEEQEVAEELIEKTQADYTHLLLNKSIYNALLTDVAAVPTTFFVDENGIVLDTVVGAMKKTAWEEKINALLEEL